MLKTGLTRTQEFLFPLYCGIRPARLEEVLKEHRRFGIEYSDWDKDVGAGTLWDLTAIMAIAKMIAPTLCFEIGTGHGRTTLHLALNTPQDSEIYTLDISTATQTGSIFRERPESRKIQQLVGDSTTFDFGKWFGKVNLVIVDGAHDYESVKRDTDTAFKLVSPDGCILWDDFAVSWPGVVKALRESEHRDQMRRIPGTKLVCYAPKHLR